jgi:hypothetical protein
MKIVWAVLLGTESEENHKDSFFLLEQRAVKSETGLDRFLFIY